MISVLIASTTPCQVSFKVLFWYNNLMRRVILFFVLILVLALLINPSVSRAASSVMQYVRGYILLQVEAHGEAWYVDPTDDHRYYLRDGPTAYVIMKLLSLGITNADLRKIPVGTDPRVYTIDGYSGVTDFDGDGLLDRLEWG